MGCSSSSPSVDSQGPSKMKNYGGMDPSKMMPLKFEYFDMHGRGLRARFVLLYAKWCMWKDCPMSNPDFAKNKESGYLKYG